MKERKRDTDKPASEKPGSKPQRVPLPPVKDFPQTRLSLAGIITSPFEFIKHLTHDCQDSCGAIFVNVELTRITSIICGWFALFYAIDRQWQGAMVSALLAVTFYAWSYFASTCFFLLDVLRNLKEAERAGRVAAKQIAKMLGMTITGEGPEGITLSGTMQMGGPPDEDPIDRIIRESREEAERRRREGGGGMVS